MIFYRVSFHYEEGKTWQYPCVALARDRWNDYGIETLHHAYFYPSRGGKIEIGSVKILQNGKRTTIIPSEFERLPEEYCSLGTSLHYYGEMRRIFDKQAEDVLHALNDCAITEEIRNKFIQDDTFKFSLIRWSESEKALYEGRQTLEGLSSIFNSKFEFHCTLNGAEAPHSVSFDFGEVGINIPHRIICLIGKNGTGKTQYLANLALGMSGAKNDLKDNFVPGRPLFSKVIAISYSIFDEFEQPESIDTFSYVYCGYKDTEGNLLKRKEINDRLLNATAKVIKTKLISKWKSIIEKLCAPERVEKLVAEVESGRQIDFYDFLGLSSGQGVIYNFVTQVFAYVEKDSLLLFDEPENHLHPNAIYDLIEILHELLDQTDSFAILATHSPIIVQQVPSKFVRVFERLGSIPYIRSLDMESFGENLTILTNEIFQKSSSDEYYKTILKHLKFMSNDELNSAFPNKLSLSARLFLQSYRNEKPNAS